MKTTLFRTRPKPQGLSTEEKQILTNAYATFKEAADGSEVAVWDEQSYARYVLRQANTDGVPEDLIQRGFHWDKKETKYKTSRHVSLRDSTFDID